MCDALVLGAWGLAGALTSGLYDSITPIAWFPGLETFTDSASHMTDALTS